MRGAWRLLRLAGKMAARFEDDKEAKECGTWLLGMLVTGDSRLVARWIVRYRPVPVVCPTARPTNDELTAPTPGHVSIVEHFRVLPTHVPRCSELRGDGRPSHVQSMPQRVLLLRKVPEGALVTGCYDKLFGDAQSLRCN